MPDPAQFFEQPFWWTTPPAASPAGTSIGTPYPNPGAGGLIDPLTGKAIDVSALREGAGTAAATISHGFGLDTLSDQRRQEALRTLRSSLGGGLATEMERFAIEGLKNPSGFDEKLIRSIFARGADQAGTDAVGLSRTIASSLGGRGISSSSPLAAGLAAQIHMQKSAQLRGVERDVTIEKLRADTQNRALAFQQALGAAQFRSSINRDIASVETQVPEYGYDALQGLTELVMEREAQEQARKDAKKASKNQLIGSIVGGALGALGGLI